MRQPFDRNEHCVTVLSQDDIKNLQKRVYAMTEYFLDLIISRKFDIGKDPNIYDEEPVPKRILF